MFKEEREMRLSRREFTNGFFNKKARASFIVLNLLLSVVAFSAMMGVVSGAGENILGDGWSEISDQLNSGEDPSGTGGSVNHALMPPATETVPAYYGAPATGGPTIVKLPGPTSVQPYTDASKATTAGPAYDITTATSETIEGKVHYFDANKNDVTEAVTSKWTSDEIAKVNEPTAKGYDSALGKIDFMGSSSWNFAVSNIVDGLSYSVMVVGAIQLIGNLAGLDAGITNAASLAAFSGIMGGEIAYSLFAKEGLLGTEMSGGLLGAAGIGIAIGVIVFVLTYSKTDTQKVKFTCDVWEPPRGGSSCEKCNADSDNYPCSEYKCKSLGASCQLLNAGTGEEKCAWVNPKDVNSATIAPNYEAISDGHEYRNVKLRPPGTGMEIANKNSAEGDGCVEAFYPLQFGVVTNEPTKCKIDYNHTQNIEQMSYSLGGSSTFKYNHTQTLALPGPANLNSEFPELQNDGVYSLFIRCEDANGNVNEDEFAVKFCVNKGPDTTPAKIESTSLINNMPISYNTTETNMLVYLNEPAECKWSKEDKDYDVMENEMKCSESIREVNNQMLYPCIANLTGIENRKDNKFYFRCKDQPSAEENVRNKNQDSYIFTIKGTQPLNILKSEPNSTIEGATPIVGIDLKLETGNGYKDGDSICYYSLNGNENTWIKFFETGGYLHKQRQDLIEGNYTYYFKCVDLGGNADYNQTKFNIYVDDVAPQIVRAYHDSSESQVCGGAGCIKIVSDEESTCTYSTTSCNFEISNGIKMPYDLSKEHFVEWKTDFNYYIKCKDKSDNQPLPTECTITLKAYNEK